MITVTEAALPGVLIIEPKVFSDERGYFSETYNKRETPQIPCEFVQDNEAFSRRRGTLRGVHFQAAPRAQAKLIRCAAGRVWDVAVDLRPESRTFKQWFAAELSAGNKKQMFIPKGFGHAYLTLTDGARVIYKTDDYYSPAHEGVILWSDPDINITWPEGAAFIISSKDKSAPRLAEALAGAAARARKNGGGGA